MTSILYKNGVYLYSTRSRIFSERGTLDFGHRDCPEHLPVSYSFHATTTSGIPITDIYYAGCMEDDFRSMPRWNPYDEPSGSFASGGCGL